MPGRPTLLRRAARSAQLRAADAAELALGRRDRLTPPRRMRELAGDSDFHATGREFLTHFTALADLRPDDRVLDIGCGAGRMARPLAGVLRPPGSYDGFDVMRGAIEWCAAHYDRTSAPFRFRHADVRNAAYNPGASQPAATYSFPYADQGFDLALATSVFTHLLEDEADRYLAETARVLAPGGRLLCTWLLSSPERPLGPGAAFCLRPWQGGAVSVADPAVPQAVVSFPEDWLRGRLPAHGLRLREPLHRGTWSGGPGLSFQDIAVAERA